ncbi:MAG: YihY/virulence factor BrkB family protein [Armatimonadota bacterium]
MSMRNGFAKPGDVLSRLAPRWWRIARVTWRRRARSVSNIMAAAIGFYALICLGPLGLLTAWVLQAVLGRRGSSYEWLKYMVNRLAGETAGAIMGEIDALISNPNAHVAGIFGAVVLLWAGLRLFEALEISLTEIWPGHEERGAVGRKLIALASMVAAGVLFVVLILLTAFLPTALDLLARIPVIDIERVLLVQPGLRVTLEVAVAFTAFFLLFKFVPVQAVPIRVAAIGALFTALLWRAATPVFTKVVARSAEHSTIYGGLAGVVMFLTWAFFGAHVLLLGAHFAAAYEHVVCRKRPESLDDSFIRMHTAIEQMRADAGEDADEAARGPSSYPPPGRV